MEHVLRICRREPCGAGSHAGSRCGVCPGTGVRRYALDAARLKRDEGQQIWTEWAILAYNTDTLDRPDPVKQSEAAPRPERNPIHHERPRTPRAAVSSLKGLSAGSRLVWVP